MASVFDEGARRDRGAFLTHVEGCRGVLELQREPAPRPEHSVQGHQETEPRGRGAPPPGSPPSAPSLPRPPRPQDPVGKGCRVVRTTDGCRRGADPDLLGRPEEPRRQQVSEGSRWAGGRGRTRTRCPPAWARATPGRESHAGGQGAAGRSNCPGRGHLWPAQQRHLGRDRPQSRRASAVRTEGTRLALRLCQAGTAPPGKVWAGHRRASEAADALALR